MLILGVPYALLAFAALLRDELQLSTKHLIDILPVLSLATWAAIGFAVLLIIALEGSFRVHCEDHASADAANLDVSKRAEEIRRTLSSELDQSKGELEKERSLKERAEQELKRRLIEPIVHLEPEGGMVSCTDAKCNFVLTLVNTGLEDVERLRVFITYFVAQRISGSVVLKRVGGISSEPSIVVPELRSKQSELIHLSFSELLPIMTEVGTNGGVPYVFGVKIHTKLRRDADGKDFDLVRCYGISLGGEALYSPTGANLPESLKASIIQLDDAIKHINSADHWSSVVTEIASTPGGGIVRKYR